MMTSLFRSNSPLDDQDNPKGLSLSCLGWPERSCLGQCLGKKPNSCLVKPTAETSGVSVSRLLSRQGVVSAVVSAKNLGRD